MNLFAKQLKTDIKQAGSFNAEVARHIDKGKTFIGQLCKGNCSAPNEEMLSKLSSALPSANINLWRKLIELDKLNSKCPLIVKDLLTAIDPDTNHRALELRDIKILTALAKQSLKEQ